MGGSEELKLGPTCKAKGRRELKRVETRGPAAPMARLTSYVNGGDGKHVGHSLRENLGL